MKLLLVKNTCEMKLKFVPFKKKKSLSVKPCSVELHSHKHIGLRYNILCLRQEFYFLQEDELFSFSRHCWFGLHKRTTSTKSKQFCDLSGAAHKGLQT